MSATAVLSWQVCQTHCTCYVPSSACTWLVHLQCHAIDSKAALLCLQADSMSSNKDMAQKYKSAADYEDDFM